MYRIDGHHPAIISPETFAAAIAMKAKRGEAAARDPQFSSAFSGMVWCGKCGCKASWHRSPQSRKEQDQRSMIWICNGRNNRKGCDCRNIQDRDIQAAVDVMGLDMGRIERIEMFDEKLKFYMKNGRAETWRRT